MKKQTLTKEERMARAEQYVNYVEQFPKFMNYENKLRFAAPKESGLYLVGNTVFNPITEEHFYLLKVGVSCNLCNRMKSYKTQNPLLFHIDYHVATEQEDDLREMECHLILLDHSISRIDKVDEWFIMPKEVYFEVCEKGFKYFYENRVDRPFL
jgi:hypothetical protein